MKSGFEGILRTFGNYYYYYYCSCCEIATFQYEISNRKNQTIDAQMKKKDGLFTSIEIIVIEMVERIGEDEEVDGGVRGSAFFSLFVY